MEVKRVVKYPCQCDSYDIFYYSDEIYGWVQCDKCGIKSKLFQRVVTDEFEIINRCYADWNNNHAKTSS